MKYFPRRQIMDRKFANTLQELASDIKSLSDNLRFNSSVQLLSSGLLLNKYIDMRASKHGLNRSRLDVMHTLITHGGILKPTDLSKMLFRSKQTITTIINNLEKDGLVKRELAGKDRRTRKVIITGKGLDSIRANLSRIIEISDSAIPPLTKAEMQIFQKTLKSIRKRLLNQINNYSNTANRIRR
jgi:DNA-binding MarR family transcriptional regulator